MKTKEQIAKDLGISRKTLYNYMDELKIKDLTDTNLKIIEEKIRNKKKGKQNSKSDLLEEIERLKTQNIELTKSNEILEQGQQVLLQQVEYLRNSIDSEIIQIKKNMILLLEAPKQEEKKTWFSKIFK